jgi:hypothetical protein
VSATATVKPDTRKCELQKRLTEIESALVANQQRANEQRAANISEHETLMRQRNDTLRQLSEL